MLLRRRKITTEDITDFLGELSMLLESGMSLDESLSFIKQTPTKPALLPLINSVHDSVQKNKGLAAGLIPYPQHVQPFLAELLAQAEREQRLQPVLAEIVRYREAIDMVGVSGVSNLVKIIGFYPMFVLGVVAFMMAFLLIFVVPRFASMYEGFGAELPGLTMLVIRASEVFQAWWWVAAFVIVVSLVIVRGTRKHGDPASRLSYLGAWLVLHSPGFGKICHTLETICSLHTWGFLLAQGLPIANALDAAASVVSTPMYASTLKQMQTSLLNGVPLAKVMQQQSLFSPKVSRALLITEHSGNKGKYRLLARLADRYAQYTKMHIERAEQTFGVFITLIVGIIVGILVISMYLPIFQMAQSV